MGAIRKTILLKPMQVGVSGYARVQAEGSRALVQLHAHGLSAAQVKLFWYLSGQTARELGSVRVNARGEASIEAEAPPDALAPGRLQALILLSDEASPAPQLIGLCAEQSAGSLMDAKNAALALCDRLRERPAAPEPPPVPVQPVQKPKREPPLPREIFLPAIDPQPYTAAREAPVPPPRRTAPPADRLRPLLWPRGFEKLKPFFEKALPCALFDLPGWRFVYAAHAGGPGGLWLGMRQIDGRVVRLAYAVRGNQPPGEGPYRPALGLDGVVYQVLWQTV